MQYLAAFIVSLLLALIFTPLTRRFALAYKLMDMPSRRKIHKHPVARLGGVAVFLSFWITIILTYIVNPQLLNFVGQKIVGVDKNFLGVILGALVILAVGVYDDYRGVKPGVKLFFHFFAAALVVIFGVKIWWIHNPLTGLDMGLGGWTYLIVPLWIVLVINVVNWLDGVDGLASGVGAIASFIMFFLSKSPEVNQPATALLAVILAGSLVGFLPYNFNPAKIFLGDTGSMFIGFMLAIFAVISGAKFATAALVLGFPILDAGWVIVRRIYSGQSVWKADRRHLHHRLLDAGLSQRQVVLFLYGLSALFGAIALNSRTQEKMVLGYVLLLLMAVLAIILLFIGNKSYNDRPKK